MGTLYLAGWRVDQLEDGPTFRPDISDLDARWAAIDLRPDGDVVDGFCLVNSLDGDLRPKVGQWKLSDNPRGRSAAARARLLGKLGVELDADLDVGDNILEILLGGEDSDSRKWNRLRPDRAGRFRVMAMEELSVRQAVRGGAVSDDFNRANEDPATGWTTVDKGAGGQDFRILSNQAQAEGYASIGVYASNNTSIGSGDHYAEITRVSTGSQMGVQARMTDAQADASGYLSYSDSSNNWKLRRTSAAASRTDLTSQFAYGSSLNGVIHRCTADGSTISMDLAGTEMASVTDTTFTATSRTKGGTYTYASSYYDNFYADGLFSSVEGAASVDSATAVSAAGVRTREGAASIASSTATAATGVRQAFGAASIATSASVAASGVLTVSGAASVDVATATAASGIFTSLGAAAVDVVTAVSAAGDTGIAGAADLTTDVTVDGGTGRRHRFGSAAVAVSVDAAGTGATLTRFGAADLASDVTVEADGIVNTFVEGAAAVDVATTVDASGEATTVIRGAAALTASALVAASGVVTDFIRGAAAVAATTSVQAPQGNIQTTGAASVPVFTYISRAYPKTTQITRLDSLVLARSRPKPGRYTRGRRR